MRSSAPVPTSTCATRSTAGSCSRFSAWRFTIGEWRGLLALALVLVSFARKSWVEEQRMREVFPEYEQYRRETAAIIPFLW